MEWLGTVATAIFSGNGIANLIFVGVIVLLLIISIKKGYISFNGNKLRLGASDKERQIIRQQMQYINTKMDGTISDIPNHLKEGLHYYRTKYIISKVKDIYEETIIYNHITNDSEYIHLKQELVYNTILKLTIDDFFKTKEFKEYIYKLVEDTIYRLVEIRKHYSN